jgi:hypothetical protein
VEVFLRYTMVDCQGLLVEVVLRYIMVSRFTGGGCLEIYHGAKVYLWRFS